MSAESVWALGAWDWVVWFDVAVSVVFCAATFKSSLAALTAICWRLFAADVSTTASDFFGDGAAGFLSAARANDTLPNIKERLKKQSQTVESVFFMAGLNS